MLAAVAQARGLAAMHVAWLNLEGTMIGLWLR